MPATTFPAIPLTSWEPAKDTLHLFLQIVGKIRLKLMPRKNHWWFATLYITARGISTHAMPYQNRTLEIAFDFIDHVLEIRTCEGKIRQIPLQENLSVAEFYRQVFDALHELDIDLKILAKPYDNKSKTPFAEDKTHHHYNPEQVQKYWHALVQIDQILKEFSGRFYGKSSPVQLYWHHFDLTLTRYNGKKVPLDPKANIVEKEAFSHEVMTFGFWPGDDTVREPAFFAYPYPLPPGIEKEPLLPASAVWKESNGSPMAFLSYENLLKEPAPKQALLDFLESAYQAGAKLSGWPVEEFRVPPLEEL
ncbi:hypothetical protein F0P94_12260 [Adhaeribacter soli]|uniref:Uncharacterized protein n=1 Tax=Adhaeribacter soli TaxID=2607655 RepID=A0A5N1ISG1_9BACT|nr:hypothetical protein F0P94_12260 [Adhaeribacter soli]